MKKLQSEDSGNQILAEEVWHLVDTIRSDETTHPSMAMLIAYHGNTLGSEDEKAVRRHLVVCPECAQTILDFAEEGTSGEEWGQSQTGQSDVSVDRERGTRVEPRHRPARLKHFLLAASLAAFAMAGWLARDLLQAHEGGRRQPEANVWVADVVAGDTGLTRGSTALQEVAVPKSYSRLVLLLNVLDQERYNDFELSISDKEGNVLFTLEGLSPRPEGGFSVEFPDPSLFVGPIRLDLYGIHQGRDLIGSFLVEIVIE